MRYVVHELNPELMRRLLDIAFGAGYHWYNSGTQEIRFLDTTESLIFYTDVRLISRGLKEGRPEDNVVGFGEMEIILDREISRDDFICDLTIDLYRFKCAMNDLMIAFLQNLGMKP